jgi:hypothetical protein
LPVRRRAALVSFGLAAALLLTAAPPVTPTQAAGEKVVIIVGPVGSLTNTYRAMADRTADAATAAGAQVVKVYSPSATWGNVRSAVAGANVIVYFGHGNGFPNPYSSVEYRDRINGFGLNTATTNGDQDSWSNGTLVYCGEKALLGTLTSSDGVAQRTHCGGGPITPAAGFTMVYAQAHYTPGFGERYQQTTPQTTLAEAQMRVRGYTRPMLQRGAGAVIATAYGDAHEIVTRVLTQPNSSYGDIFRAGRGFSSSTLTTANHPDISGAQHWVQRTSISSLHFGEPDYWYAFAGNPDRTPSGGTIGSAPTITIFRPNVNSTNARTDAIVSATFDMPVSGVSGDTFYLRILPSAARVPASVTYNAYWQRAELRPSEPLEAGTTYVVTATGGITSSASGRALTAYSWRFTTEGAPPVADDGGENQTFNPPVRLAFRQGTHTGYQFDSAGRVTAIRTLTLSRDSGASTSSRRTLPNQSGTWFSVVNGAWAGYWIRESGAVALATSASDTVAPGDATYNPPVRLSFRQGTHTGYRFDANGAMTAELTFTLAWDSGASASARRTLANQYGSWFQIVNGVWAGYWVRESDVIALP